MPSLPVLRLALAFACCLPSLQLSHAGEAPPPTRIVDVVDREFGLELPDPYRWMEGSDNAEFQDWLKAQGDFTRDRLDALPTLDAWRERLAEAAQSQRVRRGHRSAGGRVFFLTQEGSGTGTLMLREADGTILELLDPATLGGEGRASIVDFAPSPDGSNVAVGLDRDGDENVWTRVFDVSTRVLGETAVGPGLGWSAWLPDGSGFIYSQFADGDDRIDHDRYQNMRMRLHRTGTPSTADTLLLKAGSNPSLPLASSEFVGIAVPSGSRWAIAAAREADPMFRVCVAPATKATDPAVRWRCLVERSDEVTDMHVFGDTLYLVSVRGHPNGRVLALDLSDPDAGPGDAVELLAESADEVVTGLVVARDALYVKRMRSGIDGIIRIPHGGDTARELDLPGAGAIYNFEASGDSDGLMYSLQAWTMPRQVFAYDPDADTSRDLGVGTESSFDSSALTSFQTEAVSADGTRVPLTIIHRRDIALDGRNRAIIEGYGGYGYSIQPVFDPLRLAWVAAGNVTAVAHVRGGGEKGQTWRQGGHGINKRNSVDDLLASVDTLSALGYATRERIAISGRSAGGLLIGGALAKDPQRFGAAFIGVGWLNPVRVLEGDGGAAHVAESADPRTAEGLAVLAAMDPYINLRENVRYPPVLMTVGLNDPRVPGWETGKFAARLQTLGDQPAWLRAQADSGHFSATLDAQALELADIHAFFDAFLPGRE